MSALKVQLAFLLSYVVCSQDHKTIDLDEESIKLQVVSDLSLLLHNDLCNVVGYGRTGKV